MALSADSHRSSPAQVGVRMPLPEYGTLLCLGEATNLCHAAVLRAFLRLVARDPALCTQSLPTFLGASSLLVRWYRRLLVGLTGLGLRPSSRGC